MNSLPPVSTFLHQCQAARQWNHRPDCFHSDEQDPPRLASLPPGLEMFRLSLDIKVKVSQFDFSIKLQNAHQCHVEGGRRCWEKGPSSACQVEKGSRCEKHCISKRRGFLREHQALLLWSSRTKVAQGPGYEVEVCKMFTSRHKSVSGKAKTSRIRPIGPC